MAIITISRQVAARGDEVAQAISSKLGYQFITRKDIEKRIVELGFPESKMPKYDERKPGFFASLAKDRDEYFNLSQFAMLEAAMNHNVIMIGRGAFSLFKEAPNNISVRFVADEHTRIKRLQEEFNWSEKQAVQRITESDANRTGFHKNFYNVDVSEPSNYHLVLNTGLVSIQNCAEIISDYVQKCMTVQAESDGTAYIEKMLKAQGVVNKLIFDYKLKIEFMHAQIEENTVVLYGIANSTVVAEQAVRIIKQELPEYDAKSAVSIVHDFKTYN